MIGRAVYPDRGGHQRRLAPACRGDRGQRHPDLAIEDGTAHWVDLHRSADALDGADSIEGTRERALRSRGRIEMPDGEFTVVLGPQAAGELIGFLDALGFSGELAAAGVGVWARQAGQRLASELVTIADDALSSFGLPIPFDFEGTSKRRVPLFEAGVVGEPVTDLATAAALGRASTGNAHIAREEVPLRWRPTLCCSRARSRRTR